MQYVTIFQFFCDIVMPISATESVFNEEIVTGNTTICDSTVLFLYYRQRYCVFESLKLQKGYSISEIFHTDQNLWEWIFESRKQKSVYLHTALRTTAVVHITTIMNFKPCQLFCVLLDRR